MNAIVKINMNTECVFFGDPLYYATALIKTLKFKYILGYTILIIGVGILTKAH